MNTSLRPKSLTNTRASASDDSRAFAKAKPIAKRFGVHPKTVMRWAAAGHIHAHKLNDRLILYNVEEVFAFVGAARVGGVDKSGSVGGKQ
jgi:hypothetical protein